MNKYLWAKKSQKSSGYYWLPLYQHLEDTRNIICLLWNHWLSENQRNIVEESTISENYNNIGFNIASFIGAVHDIGKATFVFQAKRLGYTDDLDIQLTENLERSGFKDIYSSYNNLSSPEKSHHSIAGQYLLSKYGVKEDITC